LPEVRQSVLGPSTTVRQELQVALGLARNLPTDSLAEFLGQIEIIRITAFARLTSPTLETNDHLLNVEEASKRLNVSEDWLYRHHEQLPFTRRQGRKLLFSSNGINQSLKKSG
jgi:predicted DNA-binding transcriptional regulator AlpA